MRKLILIYLLFQFILIHVFADGKPVPGVSIKLAETRARIISDLHYYIEFNIPDSINDPVEAGIIIVFQLKEKSADLLLDYLYCQNIQSISVNGQDIKIIFCNEHIIIPKNTLEIGYNRISAEFIVSDNGLNRHKDYLYTLLVPDKARMLFPSFDQPDIKAIFHVRLSSPRNWLNISNSKTLEIKESDGRQMVEFEPTKPISTYVFAIASGKFRKISESRNQISLSLYYMNDDSVNVSQNSDEIIEATFYALKWCSDYSGLDYPFSKYDLVALPSFQFSGMEHAGATFYRSSRLFLDPNCSSEDRKSRSKLIFHETAHMWFGDLVTMKWFDEVWTKEVLANFITDKINTARYNDASPELSFLLRHYPSAYSVDRTLAPNAITQELDNLANAGSLYGPIIYDKAPIVFNMLENIIGSENLKESLREFLKVYSYKNAGWDELIGIIEKVSGTSLKEFSNSWIRTEGMPIYKLRVEYNDDLISCFRICQYDKWKRNILWKQFLTVALFYNDTIITRTIFSEGRELEINEFINLHKPLFIILNASGKEYGYFEMDKESLSYLSNCHTSNESALLRCIIRLNLFEDFLNGNIPAEEIATMIIRQLFTEKDNKSQELLISYLEDIFWHYLNQAGRLKFANELEDKIWTYIDTSSGDLQVEFFKFLISTFITRETSQKLYGILSGEIIFKNNFRLFERNYADLAYELALRNYQPGDSIFKKLKQRLQPGEISDEVKFIFPALSGSVSIRDSVFNSFLVEEKFLNENLVLKSLAMLTHPLVSPSAQKYIQPGLASAVSKKSVGSLFFSERWIETLLSGFTGIDDLKRITEFICMNQHYPQDLKMKIIQSADHIIRYKNKDWKFLCTNERVDYMYVELVKKGLMETIIQQLNNY